MGDLSRTSTSRVLVCQWHSHSTAQQHAATGCQRSRTASQIPGFQIPRFPASQIPLDSIIFRIPSSRSSSSPNAERISSSETSSCEPRSNFRKQNKRMNYELRTMNLKINSTQHNKSRESFFVAQTIQEMCYQVLQY